MQHQQFGRWSPVRSQASAARRARSQAVESAPSIHARTPGKRDDAAFRDRDGSSSYSGIPWRSLIRGTPRGALGDYVRCRRRRSSPHKADRLFRQLMRLAGSPGEQELAGGRLRRSDLGQLSSHGASREHFRNRKKQRRRDLRPSVALVLNWAASSRLPHVDQTSTLRSVPETPPVPRKAARSPPSRCSALATCGKRRRLDCRWRMKAGEGLAAALRNAAPSARCHVLLRGRC